MSVDPRAEKAAAALHHARRAGTPIPPITLADTIADNASGGGFVLGTDRRPLGEIDLEGCRMDLDVDVGFSPIRLSFSDDGEAA